MLTIAQITAIVGLLIAFNAPANQVADVQRILLASHVPQQINTMPNNPPSVAGSSNTPSVPCETQIQFVPSTVATNNSYTLTLQVEINGCEDMDKYPFLFTINGAIREHGITLGEAKSTGGNYGLIGPSNKKARLTYVFEGQLSGTVYSFTVGSTTASYTLN